MRFWVLLGLGLLLCLSACDRFDHDFATSTENTEFAEYVEGLDTQVASYLNSDQIDSLMACYASDYSNSGITLSDMRSFYTGLMAVEGNTYAVETTVNSATTLSLSYRVFTLAGSVTSVDTTFTDFARKTDIGYILYGQRAMRLLVEMFTATWCPNCPAASDAAHALVQQYPGQVLPVEYIIDDPQNEPVDNDDIKTYYLGTQYAMPVGLFQGQTKVVGGSETVLAQYPSLAAGFLAQTPDITIENLVCTFSGNLLHASFQPAGSPQGSNLRLKWAIVDEVSELNYSVTGDPITNVVIAKGDIAYAPGRPTVSLNIEYTGTLPGDAKLVVWIQNTEATYDPSTCKVYNCAETYIGR